jgi:peptidoglycan/xylan/chitin deacetylase (PgdA/CDA1 family)
VTAIGGLPRQRSRCSRELRCASALLAGLLLGLMVACSPPASVMPSPTTTPAPTLVPAGVFSSPLLSQVPQAYVADACQHLRERWDPARSAPGTIAVAVMFHSVQENGEYQPGDTFIPAQELTRTVQVARELGFATVTAAELADFLEHNVRIPRRSMIWIADDRHPDDVEDHLLPIARAHGWTVTLGWIIGDTDQRQGLWQRMEDLHDSGFLDVQCHGYQHIYIGADTPEEVMRQELFEPIPILEQHFGSRPVAYVWPGGTFTVRAVQLAREAGYRIGFSSHSRGPLMYNWIPLGEGERAVGDPLMVLPRYWAKPGLAEQLRVAAAVGDEAAAKALADYEREVAYYREMCGAELPAP